MAHTVEEHIKLGGSTYVEHLEGTNVTIDTASSWSACLPERRVWHVHIEDQGSPPMPATMILPDARTLPRGGPLYHFLVTGDPGVTQIRFVDKTYAGFFLTLNIPVSVKLYLADNSYEVGLWAWKTAAFVGSQAQVPAEIASFGSSPNTGAIDKYNFLGDIWSTESDSGNDWYRAGVSYEAAWALIRKNQTVWSHSFGTTVLEFAGGFADVHKCSFARAKASGITQRHYGIGNFDSIPLNDYYRRVPNTFTAFPLSGTADWTESTSTVVANGQSSSYFLLQTVAYFQAPYGHPSWLLLLVTEAWAAAQPLQGHQHWAPSVTLRNAAHVMGGASYRSNLFDTATRWNRKYTSSFSGWLNLPWIPNPLHGHGVRELPGERGGQRAIFSMGKDHSFFPSNNVSAWRWDDYAETYTVVSGDTWTDRQEQEVSWGHVD